METGWPVAAAGSSEHRAPMMPKAKYAEARSARRWIGGLMASVCSTSCVMGQARLAYRLEHLAWSAALVRGCPRRSTSPGPF